MDLASHGVSLTSVARSWHQDGHLWHRDHRRECFYVSDGAHSPVFAYMLSRVPKWSQLLLQQPSASLERTQYLRVWQIHLLKPPWLGLMDSVGFIWTGMRQTSVHGLGSHYDSWTGVQVSATGWDSPGSTPGLVWRCTTASLHLRRCALVALNPLLHTPHALSMAYVMNT